jgi:aminodeoxychorismate synthase component I
MPAVRAGKLPALPFAGGWVGFITYEAGLSIEDVEPTAADELGMPLLRFALYDCAAIFDHVEQTWHAIGIDWDALRCVASLPESADDRAPIADRLQHVIDVLTADHSPLVTHDSPIVARPRARMTRAEHAAKVERIREHIHAGDVYQVNLTTRFDATTTAAPLEIYRRLRAANPADFSAFIAWDDKAVLSASPELFLDLRGRRVATRPIKGTRPRTGHPAVDEARRRELLTSEKDRAELNMIVDLLRNDLGRVCRYGSIHVDSDGELETHPTVFHRVATITGTLDEGRNWSELLRATLPGGSITGAPKIAACKLIRELETTRRDVYCGAIGYIGLDGALCMNVAIRTIQMSGQRLCLHAGGGIVADSDPDEEYEELQAKAAGLLRALGW